MQPLEVVMSTNSSKAVKSEPAPIPSSDAGSPEDVKDRITLKWHPHAR
jgi:hypothetical protein